MSAFVLSRINRLCDGDHETYFLCAYKNIFNVQCTEYPTFEAAARESIRRREQDTVLINVSRYWPRTLKTEIVSKAVRDQLRIRFNDF